MDNHDEENGRMEEIHRQLPGLYDLQQLPPDSSSLEQRGDSEEPETLEDSSSTDDQDDYQEYNGSFSRQSFRFPNNMQGNFSNDYQGFRRSDSFMI